MKFCGWEKVLKNSIVIYSCKNIIYFTVCKVVITINIISQFELKLCDLVLYRKYLISNCHYSNYLNICYCIAIVHDLKDKRRSYQIGSTTKL